MIEDKFTREELNVVNLYRHPNSKTMGRNVRLAIQYGFSSLIFSILTVTHNPHFVWGVLAIFFIWMIIRLVKMKKIIGIMPGVIGKYEKELQSLKGN